MTTNENIIGLGKLLRADPRATTALLKLGQSDLARNRIKDAKEAFEIATQLSPENPRAWRLRAKALRRGGNEEFAGAMERLAQMLEKRR